MTPFRAAIQIGLSSGLVLAVSVQDSSAQQSQSGGFGIPEWLTLTANVDAGFRRAQFFEPAHDVGVLQWDGRVELWPLPRAAWWGPYARFAGIASSRDEAWENGWLSRPGLGLHVYPLGAATSRHAAWAKLLGPLRLFAEHNVVRYWGYDNEWRPRRQTRAGVDYWKAMHSNDLTRSWWLETWNGLFWQSSNEFSSQYRTLLAASSVRAGVRHTASKASSLTPYVAVETSRTKNRAYYWENRLMVGGGLRLTPPLNVVAQGRPWLTRFVFYAEFAAVARHYGDGAPREIPRTDVRMGVALDTGRWFK